MHIQSIPMCTCYKSTIQAIFKQLIRYNDGAGTGSSNNYAYLVTDDKSKDAVIIDPAHPPEYVSMAYDCVGASSNNTR